MIACMHMEVGVIAWLVCNASNTGNRNTCMLFFNSWHRSSRENGGWVTAFFNCHWQTVYSHEYIKIVTVKKILQNKIMGQECQTLGSRWA